MLLYYLFWMFMGYTKHFNIIFGTNLLTGGPAHIVVFLPILVFRRKGISTGVQTEWNLRETYFWNEHDPGDLECKPGDHQGGHKIRGRSHPPGRAPCLVGPSGLRVRTSSYVFDLSLSLSCSLYGTILMYHELCYYSWILWCFSPSTLLWWIEFPSWSYLNALSLWFEYTWCMTCRVYLWWQWDITCHLMYVLVTNLWVPPMNLCIGVGTRSWLSGRNFGALLEVLCVGWIDESEIVWCISYNHAHWYLRWQWSI